MEAAKLATPAGLNWAAKQPLRRPVSTFPIFVRASSSFSAFQAKQKDGYRGPKPKRNWVADWVSNNDDVVRSLPIYVGGIALFAVVADDGSSQSRADLLTLGLAVSNILAGLVWLSIRPKTISVVVPEAKSSEDGEAVDVDTAKLIQGSLYQGILKSGAQCYFANLSLYPAKSELPFLPPNMQAVISQPLGNRGIAIIGGDTISGFTTADQTKLMTKPASLANDSR